MHTVRHVRKVWKSSPTLEGAGVHLKRAFGYNQVPQFDPFLLFDDFKVKVICGEVDGVKGPVQDVVVAPEYLDVTVPAGTTFTHSVRRGHTAFAYVVEGEGYLDAGRDAYAREAVGVNYFDLERRCVCGPENLVLFGDGDAVTVTAPSQPLRFLLVSGRPPSRIDIAIFHVYLSYMNVKTADLKNNLSRYLRHIRATGETILVCDRDRPVATLSPLQRDQDAEWRRFREEVLARARAAGLEIEMPFQRPSQPAMPRLAPTVAPDGRTDVQTSDLLRQEKPY